MARKFFTLAPLPYFGKQFSGGGRHEIIATVLCNFNLTQPVEYCTCSEPVLV